MPQTREFKTRQLLVPTRCLNYTAKHPLPRHLQKMSNILHIASRVEAAVAAYKSVQEFTDRQEWKDRLKEEFVSIHLHGVQSFYI